MQEHRVTFSWTVAALAEGEEELESQYRVQLTILLDRLDFYDVAPFPPNFRVSDPYSYGVLMKLQV